MSKSTKTDSERQVVLGLEFSSRDGEVALAVCGGAHRDAVVNTQHVQKKARHHDDVVPAIERLFAEHGLRPGDLDEIAVSIGPGGFTGLRVAITTAKMIAFATGAAIIPVPTERVVAASVTGERAREDALTLVVAIAGKRGEYWCSVFDLCAANPELLDLSARSEVRWMMRESGRMERPLDVIKRHVSQSAVILAADHLDDATRVACQHDAQDLVTARFTAAACIMAARQMKSERPADEVYVSPFELTPEYGRPPEAVRLWEQKRSR